ncbi:MAG: tRNA pseudouridine(38-40) synthase TruA [Chlorobiaceae bacterium]|nr:tRNA pseudouridine(38-40) synthase TruA [Chlorobiaceae bacterium]
MRTIRMQIEYDGTDYSGWQRQPGAVTTVQGEIERVLGRITQEAVGIDGAGRTDRGVHARGQVASFSTGSPIPVGRMMHSANSLLPSTIRITAMRQVPDSFHARFSATSREYRYFLIERPSAIDSRFAGCSFGKPDVAAMNRLAAMLSGAHDFAAFSKESSDQHGTLCTVTEARWYRSGRFHVFRIEANRFLRSMVRFLVAGMIEAGTGRLDDELFVRMLAGERRIAPLVPADPAGLFLWKVSY